MSELTTIARPYAKAAFEYAVEANAIDTWYEMLVFAAEVSKNETMTTFLSGGASADQAQQLFLNVCEDQLNSYGQNFIKILAENERLIALPEIVVQFGELKAEHESTISVDVTSAVELSSTQEESISAALVKRLDRKVKLNCIVDKNIVSGLIIKAGDIVIDGSIQGKLNRLATTLQY